MNNLKRTFLLICILGYSFQVHAAGIPRKVKMEVIDIVVKLPSEYQGKDWEIVEEDAYQGPYDYSDEDFSKSGIELACSISSFDPFFGSNSGSLRVRAKIQAEEISQDTFRVSSIDQSSPYHRSEYASSLLEARGDCYIDAKLFLKNRLTGEADALWIKKDIGKKWTLKNETLEKELNQ